MSKRLVLVEGPDDLAALHEMAVRLFQAQKVERPPKHGASRGALFQSASGVLIDISVGLNAKDGLPKAVAGAIGGLPPQIRGDETRTDKIAVLYDPDDDQPGAFAGRIDKQLKTSLISWTIENKNPEHWALRRNTEEELELKSIAWNANVPVLDGLPDHQNLERLISQIMLSAYPNEKNRIEGWLSDIQNVRKSLPRAKVPKWKAAVLLWAALLDDQATSDVGITSRFFGQHSHGSGANFFNDFVKPSLQSSGMDQALSWVFQ